ncbi:uncharacterized protein LOC121739663 [Aricia agestis]|uniref:uncharacterized protein LOC121739663 n=1 Tax=Aricia agestis TaxID=91739 RepID=UPI001C201993|nr:uncharacterized protein LOC121739663 [Aricia agestis]
MNAQLLVLLVILCAASAENPGNSTVTEPDDGRVKLFDSVYMKIPEDGRSVVSFQIDTGADTETGRGKKKKMLEKFLPMFVMPFIIQSAIIPLFLGMIKFFLFKSLMIGKLALVLIILNSFRNSNTYHGRNDADLASHHYGYPGHNMEIGSMFN